MKTNNNMFTLSLEIERRVEELVKAMAEHRHSCMINISPMLKDQLFTLTQMAILEHHVKDLIKSVSEIVKTISK